MIFNCFSKDLVQIRDHKYTYTKYTFTSFNVFGEHGISFYGKFWDCHIAFWIFGFYTSLYQLYGVLILQFFFQINFLVDLHLYKNTGCCSYQNFHLLCCHFCLLFLRVCIVFNYYVVYPRVAEHTFSIHPQSISTCILDIFITCFTTETDVNHIASAMWTCS